MKGLLALIRGRKGALSVLGMVCATVLGLFDKVSGEAALGAVVLLSGVYSAAQASEDRARIKAAHEAVTEQEVARIKAAAPKIPPLAVLVLALSLPGLTACGGATPPGCSAEDNAIRIAAIDREYLGKLLDECLAYGERSNCPHAKRLEAERDAKVKAYEQECTR